MRLEDIVSQKIKKNAKRRHKRHQEARRNANGITGEYDHHSADMPSQYKEMVPVTSGYNGSGLSGALEALSRPG